MAFFPQFIFSSIVITTLLFSRSLSSVPPDSSSCLFFFYEFDSFWNFLFFVSLSIYPIFFFSSYFSPSSYFHSIVAKHESEDEFPNRVLCIISRISLILFPSSSLFPFPLFLLLLLLFILNPLNFKTHDEFVDISIIRSAVSCIVKNLPIFINLLFPFFIFILFQRCHIFGALRDTFL